MTKPFLYVDGERGRSNVLYFPGDSASPANPVVDSGARNLFETRVACVQDDAVFSVTGADATYIPLQDPPELPSTGTIADEAIAQGVVGIEWTGTGTSEQLEIAHDDYVFTYGENGQGFESGAWVYLEADSSVDVVLFTEFSDDTPSAQYIDGTTTTVQPEEWTYITHNTSINAANESDSRRVYMRLEAGVDQSIGDKLYVGAVALGPNVSQGWSYPVTPRNDLLNLQFSAKILGDGTLFSTRTGDSGSTNGDCFHIEAVDQGFAVRTGTVDGSSVLTTQTYTTATDLYDYGAWYDFKWTYEPSTGEHRFYVYDFGKWVLVDSGTVTTTTDALATAYGLDTLISGITAGVGSTHALIDSFGLFDDEGNGWRVFGEEEDSFVWTGSILGSELDLQYDTTANFNNSFYLTKSGWVINTDTTDKGSLSLPNRSELKYGTGDYTVVQSINAVDDSGSKPTYDDWTANTGLKIHSGGVESGPVSVSFSASPFDGEFNQILVERESGVEVRAYVNDFDTEDSSAADGGADIDNTEDLKIGYTGADSTYLSASIGVTITFDRLLEEHEKDDLFYWIDAGFDVEAEPDWLRTEAVLYLNPNDPVQQAEYVARDRLINLAVDVPEEIYVRYTFTSDDGVSNPVLSRNHVWFANLRKQQLTKFDATEDEPVPYKELGTGVGPLVARADGVADSQFIVPLEELGDDWVNNDWTVSFWARLQEDGAAENLLFHTGTSTFSIRDRSDETLSLYIGSTPILGSSVSPAPFKTYSMVTVRRSGDNFELFFNGVSDDTATNSATATPTTDLLYEVTDGGALGPLHIWKRSLSDGEIQALYNASPRNVPVLLSDNITFTDDFSTQSLNWGSI